MTSVVLGSELYSEFIETRLPRASKRIWIATADIKDMHVRTGRRFESFLSVLAGCVSRGVSVRLLHAKEPGPRFRASFDRHPELFRSDGFDRALCPRVHMKTIILDGMSAYIGSANLTGAGMGAKSDRRRNFEAGIITDDPSLIRRVEGHFDSIFGGMECDACALRSVCPDPIRPPDAPWRAKKGVVRRKSHS